MHLLKAQQRIHELLSLLTTQAKGAVAVGKTDTARVAETVLLPLFRDVFDCPALRNLNTADHQNYPGIDLADDDARIAIQVTASSDSGKVKDTLETFIRHQLHLRYDRLIIYIITEKQRTYVGTGYQEILTGHLDFDKDRDILDYRDILKRVETFQIDRARRVQNILEANFGTSGTPLFEAELPPRQESVFLNLIEVQIPEALYIADLSLDVGADGENNHRRGHGRIRRSKGWVSQRDRIRAQLTQLGLRFSADWEYHSGKLITFHDLSDRNVALTRLIEPGTIERFAPSEFYSADEDHERVFKSLLRRCLQQKLFHQGVHWQHQEGLFIFVEENDSPKRIEHWFSTRQNPREVYVRTMKNNKPDEVLKCKHLAFSVEFRRYGHRWFMAIQPDWFFSYNGYDKSDFCADDLKWLKRNENNGHVAHHIEFIGYFLKHEKSSDLFESRTRYRFLSFGNFLSFDNAPFLDDEHWRPSRDEEDEQLSLGL